MRDATAPEVTTIVTCMTDGERPFLGAALESVVRQTRPSKLLLCVEQGNDWIDDLLGRMGSDLELLRLPLAPAAVVRNEAVARVESDIVAFLDGDDVWRPRKLERQLDVLARRDLDVVASKHVLVREDGTPFFFGFARTIPMTSSWLGRTAAFRARTFDETVTAGTEDAHLWPHLKAGLRTEVMDAFLVLYRVRPASLSEGTPSKRRKDAYERRSHRPGMRPAMLATSYALNLAFRVSGRAGA